MPADSLESRDHKSVKGSHQDHQECRVCHVYDLDGLTSLSERQKEAERSAPVLQKPKFEWFAVGKPLASRTVLTFR